MKKIWQGTRVFDPRGSMPSWEEFSRWRKVCKACASHGEAQDFWLILRGFPSENSGFRNVSHVGGFNWESHGISRNFSMEKLKWKGEAGFQVGVSGCHQVTQVCLKSHATSCRLKIISSSSRPCFSRSLWNGAKKRSFLKFYHPKCKTGYRLESFPQWSLHIVVSPLLRHTYMKSIVSVPLCHITIR